MQEVQTGVRLCKDASPCPAAASRLHADCTSLQACPDNFGLGAKSFYMPHTMGSCSCAD